MTLKRQFNVKRWDTWYYSMAYKKAKLNETKSDRYAHSHTDTHVTSECRARLNCCAIALLWIKFPLHWITTFQVFYKMALRLCHLFLFDSVWYCEISHEVRILFFRRNRFELYANKKITIIWIRFYAKWIRTEMR